MTREQTPAGREDESKQDKGWLFLPEVGMVEIRKKKIGEEIDIEASFVGGKVYNVGDTFTLLAVEDTRGDFFAALRRAVHVKIIATGLSSHVGGNVLKVKILKKFDKAENPG